MLYYPHLRNLDNCNNEVDLPSAYFDNFFYEKWYKIR